MNTFLRIMALILEVLPPVVQAIETFHKGSTAAATKAEAPKA